MCARMAEARMADAHIHNKVRPTGPITPYVTHVLQAIHSWLTD